MSDRQMLNISVALLVIAAAVLALADWSRNSWNWKAYAGLLIILILVFLWPLVGLIVSIPVAILVWFRNYQTVFNIFNQLKGGR